MMMTGREAKNPPNHQPALRKILVESRRLALHTSRAVRQSVTKKTKIAHHGIQRSGTNYLCALLEQSGYFVLNSDGPRRDSPAHKHFRWQDDKSTIVMDRSFSNALHASEIDELNRIANFPRGTKHVVLVKKPGSWLESAYRWGRANGWMDEDADFLGDPSLAAAWLAEWDAYYNKWLQLAEASPGQVLVVSYESLMSDRERVMSRIRQLTGTPALTAAVQESVKRVAHSPAGRSQESIRATDPGLFDELVERNVHSRWESFDLY